MFEHLKNILQSGDEAVRNFNTGLLTGLAIVLIVLILLFILRLIIAIAYRQKKSDGITLDSDLGDIFISASAVTSAIRSLERDFPAYIIQKVRLYKSRQNKVTIWILLCYDGKGGCFKPYTEKFQRKVIDRLREMFGIESIDKVRIALKNDVDLNVVADIAEPEKKDSDDEKAASPVFQTTPVVPVKLNPLPEKTDQTDSPLKK